MMRRTCLRAAVPGSVVRLSMKLQTPGLPEGQQKGRLGFFSSFSLCPPFAFYSTSLLPLFFARSVSAIQMLVDTSCCAACTQVSYLTSPTLPHQSWQNTHQYLHASKFSKKLQTFWVTDLETTVFAQKAWGQRWYFLISLDQFPTRDQQGSKYLLPSFIPVMAKKKLFQRTVNSAASI